MREMDKDKKTRFSIDSISLKEDTLQKYQTDPSHIERVKALADNIFKNGLQKPIDVVHCQDGSYLLIEGYHRYMAFKLLNLKEIECVVKESINPSLYIMKRIK
jgi:ParB-like chromosome segregation protein Spo0J